MHGRVCVRDITFLVARPPSYAIFCRYFRLLPPFCQLRFYVERNLAPENGEGRGGDGGWPGGPPTHSVYGPAFKSNSCSPYSKDMFIKKDNPNLLFCKKIEKDFLRLENKSKSKVPCP